MSTEMEFGHTTYIANRSGSVLPRGRNNRYIERSTENFEVQCVGYGWATKTIIRHNSSQMHW